MGAKEKERTGCLIAISFLILAVWFVPPFLIKSAFGPNEKTLELGGIDEGRLIGEQIYSADLAAVFYRVEFKLINEYQDTLILGKATFSDDNWQGYLKIIKIGGWIILIVNDDGYSKLLMNNWEKDQNKEIVFSPFDLKKDTLWHSKNIDLLAQGHHVSSRVDSVVGNKIYVYYAYGSGIKEPDSTNGELVEYELDTESAKLKINWIHRSPF